uniref:Uncharacterized protein n=1 Tax=Arundo donax TaxID=35708 RepID=A0A0A8Y8J1_ARUDO
MVDKKVPSTWIQNGRFNLACLCFVISPSLYRVGTD